MKIANLYSHLNGYEYLLVHRKKQWEEITEAIELADSQSKQLVVLPIKYEKILSELKKTN